MEHRLYNLKKLNELAQGDKNFVRDMVVMFVENVTSSVNDIYSLKPVENWKKIGEIAHKLATNFAYLGADKLQTIAADIEKSILCDKNLDGVAEKTEAMCNDAILVIGQLKEKFEIINEI